jgi:hypothetical protein
MRKLTDTQLIVLSSAIQRDDGLALLPAKLKGGAAAKVVKPLLDQGLLKEVRAKPDMPTWRRDEDAGHSYALAITRAGGRAINADAEDDDTAADEKPARARGKPKGKRSVPPSTRKSTPRAGTKTELLIGLLSARKGATIEAIVTATGWQPHTTRAAFTGLRKRGYRIEKEPGKEGTVYRITAAPDPAGRARSAGRQE